MKLQCTLRNEQTINYLCEHYEWNSNFVLSFREIPIMSVPCIPRITGPPINDAYKAILMRRIREVQTKNQPLNTVEKLAISKAVIYAPTIHLRSNPTADEKTVTVNLGDIQRITCYGKTFSTPECGVYGVRETKRSRYAHSWFNCSQKVKPT